MWRQLVGMHLWGEQLGRNLLWYLNLYLVSGTSVRINSPFIPKLGDWSWRGISNWDLDLPLSP